MTAYRFKGLLQKNGWISPAFVHLDEAGNVLTIGKVAAEGIKYTAINGLAIPGLQNAHSHAFQYAMVGLTERHQLSQQRDDFWGWRNAMYQLALSVNPDEMEAIATMLYMEMLRHGYTHVAEFHYVHHDISGQPYGNLAELGERLIAAAKKAGIKITLVPIFYQKGGFGKTAEAHQRRFLSKDINHYLQLLAASKKVTEYYEGANLACGVHSLRAVEPTDVKKLIPLVPNLPFHLHIAEQLKEVSESKAYLGKRPVEWLSQNIDLKEDFHLVHATHLTAAEVEAIAISKANVVLCPTTEGNLGDGIFALKAFQKAGGNWSIGTDSHIGINPFEELRLLDYGQRLISHQRNTFTDGQQGDSGLYALQKLVTNGRLAMGNQQTDYFEKGAAFDALILDSQHPILAVCSEKNLASTIVYAADVSMHLGTMVNGQWAIKKGRHQASKLIIKHFKYALNKLKNR